MKRRDFVKLAGGALLVASSGTYAVRLLAETGVAGVDESTLPVRRWGMVIDLNRCDPDCTACVDACRQENNVASHGDNHWDSHWIRKVNLEKKGVEGGERTPMLLLCNHCDNPPCAQVCPVQATYKRHDGIVIVDHHRCIGCRYCMIACPYNARFFNFRDDHDWPNTDRPKRSHGVAESCHLCAHRLDEGRLPACVEACRAAGTHAISVGDLDDPSSEVSMLIAKNAVQRLRPDLGTEPKVYYIGL